MHRLEDTWARAYYSTLYMGTDGRWHGANSPIDPWRHGNEGGVERGYWRVLDTRRLDPRGDRPTAPGNRVPGGDTGRTKLPNPRAPPALSDAE